MTPSVKISVYEAIAAVDPAAAHAFDRRFFHPQRKERTLELELNDVNSFWRIQLSQLSADTLKARSALCSDVSIERWLVMFINDVVPCIVEQWYPSLEEGTL
jgi:hypothetical protein